MFLSYNGGVEAKNEVRTLKIFLEVVLGIFGACQKYFGHPAPEGCFFALVIFRPKVIFAKNQDFNVFVVSVDQNGLGTEKIFHVKNTL